MSLLRALSGALRALFRMERVEGERDEELRGFLEMAAEEKMKLGMSRKDALLAVRLERGSLEVAKEVVRTAGWESLVKAVAVLLLTISRRTVFFLLIFRGNASMADKPSDLVQGTPDMLILKTLALEPLHGYGIAVRLEQISKGVFRLNAGSLFVAFRGRQVAAIARILEA